jgi:UDP-N-acetylmuramate--alanine ligase
VGGIGLSAIARVLSGWGYNVSGSDLNASEITAALEAEGIAVQIGHRTENVPVDPGLVKSGSQQGILVIVSSAIPEGNPELVAARRLGLSVVKRQQLLGELTAGKYTLAVAGTHGKTTTSSMVAWILEQAGKDPTFVVGGLMQNLGTNARAGKGAHFVIEADEYDRTFLGLQPDLAVVTTLDHDHPDCYPTFAEMKEAFSEFVRGVRPGGRLVLCGEDPEALRLAEVARDARLMVETYGFDDRWDWWADGVHLGNHAAFEAWHRGRKLGTCALQVPGRHNVLNSLAALAASSAAGVDFESAAAALTRYRGTARRFEVKGQAEGITIVDDYAHHPTEIQATLDAARIKFPGRTIWAVFQPHTYSRTAALLEDFAATLAQADKVIVTGIYAAREKNIMGISGLDVLNRMRHPGACYAETMEVAIQHLMEHVQPGDVVFTLGAGDGYLIGEAVLDQLRQRSGLGEGSSQNTATICATSMA